MALRKFRMNDKLEQPHYPPAFLTELRSQTWFLGVAATAAAAAPPAAQTLRAIAVTSITGGDEDFGLPDTGNGGGDLVSGPWPSDAGWGGGDAALP
ncbi:hypothetical protein LX32DRAFT_645636 [Colletotrichum zoysiae]|uniref:Uncharacterized protein n=1 Tax=Colletotrichum zoysiae TaxID=1216348 RepID=A0AAD9H542_9PEZI|nr:hypothetical protein LX32DRAFT_645636 [Colletotrichum zoysiae]